MKPSELFLLQRNNKFCGDIIFLSGGQLKILVDQSDRHTRKCSVLNTAARLVCCAACFNHISHITPLMYELHGFPLKQRFHFKILLFAFKAVHGIAPTYIQNLVSLKSQGAYNLRSSGGILLALSTFRTKVILGDRSFQVAAPKLWNALPRELRDIPNLHTF